MINHSLDRNLILRTLFYSKITIRLIDLFLKNPHQSYYQTEIVGEINGTLGSTQYKLKKLVAIGFLKIQATRTKTFYSLNQRFPHLKELKSIFK